MASEPRVAPRFVPTLTTIVELPDPVPTEADRFDISKPPSMLKDEASPVEAPVLDEANSDVAPPRYATLPEISQVALSREARDALEMANFEYEEEILHRVLQRVDASLEERLTDEVSASVQRHLDAMVPEIRSGIEQAVRALVVDALAHELGDSSSQGISNS